MGMQELLCSIIYPYIGPPPHLFPPVLFTQINTEELRAGEIPVPNMNTLVRGDGPHLIYTISDGRIPLHYIPQAIQHKASSTYIPA